jgi:hypothetical protein
MMNKNKNKNKELGEIIVEGLKKHSQEKNRKNPLDTTVKPPTLLTQVDETYNGKIIKNKIFPILD